MSFHTFCDESLVIFLSAYIRNVHLNFTPVTMANLSFKATIQALLLTNSIHADYAFYEIMVHFGPDKLLVTNAKVSRPPRRNMAVLNSSLQLDFSSISIRSSSLLQMITTVRSVFRQDRFWCYCSVTKFWTYTPHWYGDRCGVYDIVSIQHKRRSKTFTVGRKSSVNDLGGLPGKRFALLLQSIVQKLGHHSEKTL